MALNLKFKYEISVDRSKLIITDQTGVYDANNTGGWGSPNPDRSEIGLLAYVSYQPYSTDLENLNLTQAISSPYLTDITYTNAEESVFEFNYTKDGWYRIALIALTQEEYEGLGIDDYEGLINSPDHPNAFTEDIIMVNLITQRNCQLEKYLNCLQCTTCKCDQIREEYYLVNSLIQGTDYRFHSAKQYEAQKMVETLTKQFKCCK